ncbi:MAG: hypothetical protein IKM97_02885 [Clostridia bacterium]|nr:hypothetical protein [Clostridia bacterium]
MKKLEVYGEENLTSEELLSIVIWGKNISDKKIKIIKKIIKNNKELNGNLEFLMHISVNELIEQGLEQDEAFKTKAISGIFKKLCYPISSKKIEISSSTDVVNFFMPELRYEKNEIVKIVILTNKNQVLKIATLSIGTSSSATISPKDILSDPVKMKASKIILVHNHPSRRFQAKSKRYSNNRNH